MLRTIRSSLLFPALISLAACGTNQASLSSSGGASSAGPTKEKAVQTLRDFRAAYNAGNMKEAKSLLKQPDEPPLDMQYLAGQLGLGEGGRERIDVAEAINIIAERGKWGKLGEIFTKKHPDMERAKSLADRVQVPLDKCYALSYETTEAIFYWDGTTFKIIFLDDFDDIEHRERNKRRP